MDPVDKFILGELMASCRVTARSISSKLNLSPTSVQNRITKLRNTGGISRGYVYLSLAMLDADIVCVGFLQMPLKLTKMCIERLENILQLMNQEESGHAIYMLLLKYQIRKAS